MAELTQGIAITLGGKERRLKIDLNAMINFKHVTGKSFLKGFNMADLDEEDLRALIWAGLLKDEPTLTLETVGSWIDENLGQSSSLAIKAVIDSLPDKKATASPNGGSLPLS